MGNDLEQSGDAEALRAYLGTLRAAGRFAPKPGDWNRFWKAIGKGVLQEDSPPAPLILSAHWNTSAQEKHDRLYDQLEWAREHGRLDLALSFLDELDADAWAPLPAEKWRHQSGGL